MKSYGASDNPGRSGPKPDATGSPIDVESALERAMGDLDFLEMMLRQFLEQMPGVLEELANAFHNGDGETVRRQAHTLKGSAANLSATEIAAMALQLEEMGNAGELKEGEKALDLLRNEMIRLKTYISSPGWCKRESGG